MAMAISRIDIKANYEDRKKVANCINIPSEALREFKKDKRAMRMLAFSFMIKCGFTNSVICLCHNRAVSDLVELFGCDRKTLNSLIKEAKDFEPLFSWDEKHQTLTAKSYRRRYARRLINRKVDDALCAYCIRFKNIYYKFGILKSKTDRPRFRSIIVMMRKSILEMAVRENYADGLNATRNELNRRATGLHLTDTKGAKTLGVCRATYKKYVKEMREGNKIKVIRYPSIHFSDPTTFGFEIDSYSKKGYNKLTDENGGVSMYKPSVIFASDLDYRGYRHVIFNHEKRMVDGIKTNKSSNGYDRYMAKYGH